MRNPVNALNIEHLSRHQYNLKLCWKSIWKLKYSKIHPDFSLFSSLFSSLFKFNLSSSRYLMIPFLVKGPEAFVLSIFASFSSHNRKYWNNFKNPNTSFYCSLVLHRSFLSTTQDDALKVKCHSFQNLSVSPHSVFFLPLSVSLSPCLIPRFIR